MALNPTHVAELAEQYEIDMKHITGIFLLCLACHCVTAAASEVATVTLVEDGNAQAVIVLRASPNEIERSAALDLQQYLMQMSGAKLSIAETDEVPDGPVILIGHSEVVRGLISDVLDEYHLGYDGFVIKTFPNRLVLVGRDPNRAYREEHEGNGTRFAVFALLEMLGCRFFNPSPVGEHVPRMSTIQVTDLDVVSKPDFMRRRVDVPHYVRDYFGPHMKMRWKRWYLKNRFGGVPITTSHNYDGICSPKLFESHPEYFSYDRDLKRRVLTDNNQLCLSNPGVVARAVNESERFLNVRRDVWGASLSPADSDMDEWCECDSCLAMDHSDPAVGKATRVLAFNNKVAAEVQKSHPDRFLTYYADYRGVNLNGPPVLRDGTVLLKAHSMIVPVIVNRYCYLHDITDPNCPLNADYLRNLRGWKKVADHLMCYEYFTHHFELPRTPTPQTWQVGPRIKHYKQLGFVSFKAEALCRWPDNDLALYIAGRMAWDADQDDRALIDEYFRLYFQEAAGPMKEYYRLLNNVGRDSGVHHMFLSHEVWTPRLLAKLRQSMNLAEETARQDAVIRRVQREADALKALTLISEALLAKSRWQADSTPKNKQQALDAVEAAISFIQSIADQNIVASYRINTSLERKIRRTLAGAD